MKKVLIANRGEIAARIQRACVKMGIKSVIAISEADKNSYFARNAEELVVLGPPAPQRSYLDIQRIIEVAKQSGADAVHPGYGFLSENASFARAVSDAGLIFIGPDADTIRIMGSKTEARALVTKRGVPTTSGSPAVSDAELIELAQKIGFPVLIKAVAGGGGRGMRVVRTKEEMAQSLALARGEALKNFSNDSVYIEKYVEQPRHVEVQILGDAHGTIVHLGTRDCSTQRRHQKLIEEAPAPGLDSELRERIHAAAVAAAQSVNYKNAGTVEFLVKGNEFYFLEMNTRIQVEHPVTEMVTGIDLVEMQLRVARGEKLPFSQKDITFTGHAIEFRLCAEDPEKNFMPTKGRIRTLSYPEDAALRVDYGFEQGDEISTYYDGMMAKILVKGEDRAAAIKKSYECIRKIKLEGLKTNLDFHRWMLLSDRYRKAPLDISYLEREFSERCIAELREVEAADPLYKKPFEGWERKEYYECRSSKFSTNYTVEVTHRRDGFFVGVPIAQNGVRARKENCRVSNGLKTLLETVRTDVLEKVSAENL